MMRERRRAIRELTLKPALLLAAGHALGISCMVRNSSRYGACLQIPQGLRLPTWFDVVLGGSGATFRAQIVWRTGNRIGVSFANDTGSRHTASEVA